MVRWRRLVLLVLAGVVAAAAATVLAVAVNVATGGTAKWFPSVERYPLWWTAGATAAVAVASMLVWAAQRWFERGLSVLIPAVQRPEPWVVDRPAEVDHIVATLRRSAGTVGITTAVHGAGGFGKTTVAKMVRADRRVLRRFRGRVYWVTLGRDVGKQALAGLTNGLIRQVEPGRETTSTDARQAAEQLAAVLAAGPRRLVVLDDVWSEEQLAAFPVGGRCARLVTTRIPSLAKGTGVPVKVDQMSETQARTLLSAGLPLLPAAVAAGLLEETGRWPLLLRLVNKILADQAQLQPDIAAAAEDLLGRLRRDGALQVDQLAGAAGQQLDIGDPDQRQRAVLATIQASTSLLSAAEHDRFAELAVFAEDETIPVTLITVLWRSTGGLDRMATGALCARLADLALLTLVSGGDGGVTVHDVIRDFLRDELGSTRLAQLHQLLLNTVAQSLPAAAATPGGSMVTAWWELPGAARYLWEHLIEHLLAAGRAAEAAEVAADLRWVGARLQASGPAGPYADLALTGTPRANRLGRVLGQAAHLLAPTDPPQSLIDILYSRVSHDPDWGAQTGALTADRKPPRLINKWPPPDLPDPALRRTLAGHGGPVTAVAIAPDGTWLASAGDDESVRIWDPVTGELRFDLTGRGPVTAVAIAPDGTWLASGGGGGSVRIWDPVTGELRAALTGRGGPVRAVAIAPDGTWLVSGWGGGSVRIWDPVTGELRAALTGRSPEAAVAIAPDGTWLASGGGDGSVRIWDPVTGELRATLTGHRGLVRAVAIAPDGTWLASGGGGGSVRIWDPVTGVLRAALTGHAGPVGAVAIAPDGTWLVSGGDDGSVRIWDPVTGVLRAALTGHAGAVGAVAIAPDGTWLVSGGDDGSVRTWDPATSRSDTALIGPIRHTYAVAFAPDGTWLASGGGDGSVRIWDPVTGELRATLTGHRGLVRAVAIAPDGTWLASGGGDKSVRIWDPVTGELRADLTGHSGLVRAVAIAPDGTWLASSSDDGSVRIWDPVTGVLRAALTGHAGPVGAVAIAPDGTWLASADRFNWSVRIWDPVTGELRAALTDHAGPVGAVAIAPDGTWLASGGDDGSVRIWDPLTGALRASLTGHRQVRAVAIAPDGAWLASATDDGSVRIWDRVTGDISTLMRVDGWLQDCAWSPSSESIGAAGGAGLYHFAFKP